MPKSVAKYPGLRFQPGHAKSWGRFREFIRTFMRAQFGRPSGIWGVVVGAIMVNARSNQERVRWTLEQLELQPNDRVLEIGFGPGYAVAEACKRLPGGFIAGVDHSEIMVRQATKKNAEAIAKGKVELRLGSASDLPIYGELFDKIVTINSIHFWPDPILSLKELRERLKPDNLIAVTLQPRSRGSSSETTKEIGRELKTNLEAAGFRNVRLEFKHAEPAPVACAIGIR